MRAQCTTPAVRGASVDEYGCAQNKIFCETTNYITLHYFMPTCLSFSSFLFCPVFNWDFCLPSTFILPIQSLQAHLLMTSHVNEFLSKPASFESRRTTGVSIVRKMTAECHGNEASWIFNSYVIHRAPPPSTPACCGQRPVTIRVTSGTEDRIRFSGCRAGFSPALPAWATCRQMGYCLKMLAAKKLGVRSGDNNIIYIDLQTFTDFIATVC